jgi:plasmid stability protein
MAEDFQRALPDQYMLRLPPGMRDDLKARAKANKRSMNAEIVAALEAWLNPSSTAGMAPATIDRISLAFAQVLESDPEFGPIIRRAKAATAGEDQR